MKKIGRPPSENPQNVKVSCYITEDEWSQIREILGRRRPRTSMSAALREILIDWLERQSELKPGEEADYFSAKGGKRGQDARSK